MDISSDTGSESGSGSGSDLEIIDCRPAATASGSYHALEVLAITDDDTSTTGSSGCFGHKFDTGTDSEGDVTILPHCPHHSPTAFKRLTLAERSERAVSPRAPASNTATPTAGRGGDPQDHLMSTAPTAPTPTATTLQRKSLQKQAEARPAGYLVISSDDDDDDDDSSPSSGSDLEIIVFSRSSPKRARAVVIPPSLRNESSGDDLPAPQGTQKLLPITSSALPPLSPSLPRHEILEAPSNQGSNIASTSRVQIEQLSPLPKIPPSMARHSSVAPNQPHYPHPTVSTSRLFIPKSRPSSSSSWKSRPDPTRISTIRVNLSSNLLNSGHDGWVKAIPRRSNPPDDRFSRLPQSPPKTLKSLPTGPTRHPTLSPPKNDSMRPSSTRSPTRNSSSPPQQVESRRSNDLGLDSETDSSQDGLPLPFGPPSPKFRGNEDVAAALPTPAATISPSLAADSSLNLDKGKGRASEWTDPEYDREMEADDEGEFVAIHGRTPDYSPASHQTSPDRSGLFKLTVDHSASTLDAPNATIPPFRHSDTLAPTPKQTHTKRTKKGTPKDSNSQLHHSSSTPPVKPSADQNPTSGLTPEREAEAHQPQSKPTTRPESPNVIQQRYRPGERLERERTAPDPQVNGTVSRDSLPAPPIRRASTSTQPYISRRSEAQRLRRQREREHHDIEARMIQDNNTNDGDIALDPTSIENCSALNLMIVKKRRLGARENELKLGTRERRTSKRIIKAPLQTLPNGLLEVDMRVDQEVLAQVDDVDQLVREVNIEVAQVNEEMDSLQERCKKFVLMESARPAKGRQILGPELEDEKNSDVRATLIQVVLNARAFEMQTGEKADNNPRYDTSSHTLLFESLIADVNSYELSAPCRIRVIPPVDGGKPHSPPFEFVYTNRVILPQGSAPEAPSACDCEGNCGDAANLERCACRKRQREASRTIGAENERSGHNSFAWESDGTLNDEVFGCSDPIWECNAGCGCDKTCVNHVVGKKRSVDVDIYWTGPMKGWGVRNPPTHDIDPQSSMPFMPDGGSVYRGRVIRRREPLAIYAGEQIPTSDTPERVEVYDKLCRNYIYDLDHFHIPEEAGKDHLYRTQGRKPLSGNGTKKAQKYGRDLAAFADKYKQRVMNKELGYCVDAFLRGNWTRFCNHSCSEFNAISRPVYVDEGRVERPLLVLFASRDIQPGEEIRISYHSESSPEFKQAPHQTRGQYKALLKEYRAKANARRLQARPEFRCYCGEFWCRGVMFNGGDDETDLSELDEVEQVEAPN
ncbi:BQ2448_5837 [Microbotryum intermedium]|uniref:BQ2448_5837 protein n=1 Tax=Microbotryum intermedium TaxID=269621 RepID=A0A238F5F9_9BASI|nr:BQ2448_5837 [Microbotryum intermedium]